MNAYRRSVVVAGSSARTRRRLPPPPGMFAAIVLAGLIAVAVVVSQRGTTASNAAPPTTPVATLEPSRANAVSTAVEALDALSGYAITDREQFSVAVERLSAPGTQDHVRAVFGETDPEIVAAFRHQPSVLRFAPLGYRVDSYDDRMASIAIWSVAIAAAVGKRATSQWRTLVIDLAWTSRGWKVTDGAGVDGPSPATSQPELAAAATGFRSFRYAP